VVIRCKFFIDFCPNRYSY